jgi:hypothetical protein
MGHRYIRDVKDLIQLAEENPEQGWDKKILEALPEETGVRKTREKFERGRGGEDVPERGEVALIDVWVPEHRTEKAPDAADGFHGTIFTMVDGVDLESLGGWPRNPRPAYCPRWGPYVFGGVSDVPSRPFPLSPLVSDYNATQRLKKHAQLEDIACEEYRRILLTMGLTEPDAQKLATARNGTHVNVAGEIDNKVKEVVYGGLTNELIARGQMLREALNRESGLTDAQRGVVAGEGPATEIALAAQSGDQRIGQYRSRFAQFVTDLGITAAWYMHREQSVVFPMADETVRAVGLDWFLGGTFGGHDFDDLELDIKPYSMEHVSTAVQHRRVVESLNLAGTIIPLLVQYPGVLKTAYIDEMLKSLDMPSTRELIDVDQATALGAAMIQAQVQPEPPALNPRFVRTVPQAHTASRQAIERRDVGRSIRREAGVNGKAMPGRQAGGRASATTNQGGM